jgi:hypothetical protein
MEKYPARLPGCSGAKPGYSPVTSSIAKSYFFADYPSYILDWVRYSPAEAVYDSCGLKRVGRTQKSTLLGSEAVGARKEDVDRYS